MINKRYEKNYILRISNNTVINYSCHIRLQHKNRNIYPLAASISGKYYWKQLCDSICRRQSQDSGGAWLDQGKRHN